MNNKESIPEIYTKSLAEYELAVLGLKPEKMLRIFCHSIDNKHLCIHAARLSMSGPWNSPTITIEDNAIGHQPFDLGGYHLNPIKSEYHE